jgi:hypothetical protein
MTKSPYGPCGDMGPYGARSNATVARAQAKSRMYRGRSKMPSVPGSRYTTAASISVVWDAKSNRHGALFAMIFCAAMSATSLQAGL